MKRPNTDDWIEAGCGFTGVALAAVLFLSTEDPFQASILLIVPLALGELIGRAWVAFRRRKRLR